MSSTIEICNLALTKLGAARITSLADDSKQARALSAIFDPTRDAELVAHPWSFAIVRAALPASSTAPAFGWARAYPLPADCLHLVQVGDSFSYYDSDAAGPGFDVEGGAVLTDAVSPLLVRYTYRVTNSGLFPPLFVQSLACRLAFELAEELTQNLSKREAAWAERKDAIREAKRANVIERPPQTVPDLSWVRAMTQD
jgi:hypothetical protein